MFLTGRWLYVVFMCQQALEKLCKGLYLIYIDDDIPRSHDIPHIVSLFMDKLHEPIREDCLQLFRRLSSFYLQSRYPEYKDKLSTVTGEIEAKQLLERTKEAFEWLLTLKP
jgi:HEPN domain-containing protein